MKAVGAYRTRDDAWPAQAALAAAGIPSVLEADDAGGAYPFDLTGAARLFVNQPDAEEAAAVLCERPADPYRAADPVHQPLEAVMSSTVETAVEIRPFRVEVPDEALDDLRRRIASTNWP